MFQCVTKDGKELTRVSLVDGDGKCLMDELVKPANHILNYCTKYTRFFMVSSFNKLLRVTLCLYRNLCQSVSYVTSYRNIFIVLSEILSPTLLVSPDRFSGITPAMLQRVTTTLQDVQEMLIRILPHEAVLVGHSLEHDLIALKVSDFFQTFWWSHGSQKQNIKTKHCVQDIGSFLTFIRNVRTWSSWLGWNSTLFQQ